MKSDDTFPVYSLVEIETKRKTQDHFRYAPQDPRNPDMFVILHEEACLCLWWGGYEYSVPLISIAEPDKLLWLVHHVLSKDWDQTTQERVVSLIEALAGHFGWEMYGALKRAPQEPALSVRTTSDAEERSKLTPKLRYDVLVRDNFRCRACGASPETGAHLHIDHVKPISDGGLTIFDNLQALCSPCNYGKGARK
jgi:hypothetical protein